MAVPWTQTLSLNWRPALRFYEERVGILRTLDDDGVLAAFRVDADRIDARFGDGHSLKVEQSGMTLQLFGLDADLDPLWDYVMLVCNRVQPARIRGVEGEFQHIVGLDLSFEQAVARGHERLYSLPPSDAISYGDWALLMDMTCSDGRSGQVEFGIIRNNEAPRRLTRASSRMGTLDRGPQQWSGVEFPEVGLFSDSRWSPSAPLESGEFDQLRAFWDAASSSAGELVDALYEKIST